MFGRRSAVGTAPDAAELLVARTRRRLAALTLLLIAALLIGAGAITAFLGLSALDGNVDRSLQTVTRAVVDRLDGTLPGASTSGGEDGESGSEDRTIAGADTFFLYLDAGGHLSSSTAGRSITGLPDAAAVAAARGSGSDLRSIQAGALHVRLLTLPVPAHDAQAGNGPAGFVQAGFVLTLHDEQASDLVRAIVVVVILGLLGAAVVTVYLTGRALVPVRAAFAYERRFVAGASHELRTPAALIRASAEVLEREQLVTEEGRPLVGTLVAESDRLARLVSDLLALASSEAASLSIEPRPVDLGVVAAETVRRATPLATERGVAVRLEPAARPELPVLADPDRLVQVLLALLDNAFRHSPAGGTVTVSAERSGGLGAVAVTDQGPGVPAAERERIFEPFARLGRRRAGSDEGSGLGLAIARTIVQRHGGTLHVEDASGGGARFVVRLPLR